MIHQHHQLEPRHRYADNEDRLDIAFLKCRLRHSQRITVDIFNGSCAPLVQGHSKGAAKECGYATAKREAIKTNKYSKEALLDGSKSTVIPLCLNILDGGGSCKAEEFLDELARRGRDIEKKCNLKASKQR